MAEDDKTWVYGLDGPGSDVEPAGPPAAPPPRRPRRLLDPLMFLAVFVGVVVGVAIYAAWFQPPAAPQPIQYTVVSGDSLWRIANSHGVSVAALKEWNGLQDNAISPGQVLRIYPPEASSEVEARTASGRGGRIAGGRIEARPQPQDPGGLRMPEAKPCLGLDEAALDGVDEPAMIASRGLSYAQTRGALDAFLPTLQRCIPEQGANGAATFEITVGCNGRVDGVRVVDQSGLDAEVVGCLRDTLRYAGFPAHDMPDGFTFAYPVVLEFGE